MSGKTMKKQRQIARKIFRDTYEQMAEIKAEQNTRFLKPKPKWVPFWLWLAGLKIFVKVK